MSLIPVPRFPRSAARRPAALLLGALVALPLLAAPAGADAPSRAPYPVARPGGAAPAPAVAPAPRPAPAGQAAAAASAGSLFAASARDAAKFARPPSLSPLEKARLEREAQAALDAASQALVDEAGISGRSGYALIDIASGEILQEYRGRTPFPPASTVKALTALYALETLGAGHRFETVLAAGGPLSPEGAAPSLHLIGGMDPDLDTDDLRALVDAARAAGLTRVAGPLTADGSALPTIERIDDEQSDAAAYNPSVGALNLNYNRAQLVWAPGKDGPQLSVRAAARRNEPEIAAVAARTGAEGAVFIAAGIENGAETWEVAASALKGEGRRWLPVRRPGLYAADALRALAAAQGIAAPTPTSAAAPAAAVPLARHESPSLQDIARGMLRWSTNLTAETLGLAASAARGSVPQDLRGSAARMSEWAKAKAGLGAGLGLDLRNHSGLSAASRITPEQMARFLRAAALGLQAAPTPPTAAGLAVASNAQGGPLGSAGAILPPAADAPSIADAPAIAAGAGTGAPPPRGPLFPILRPVALGSGKDAPPRGVQAAAKTGTLLFVRGLAGYLDTASGRRLAFAIYSEDLTRRSEAEDMDRAPGSRSWLTRATRLEKRLLNAWARRF